MDKESVPYFNHLNAKAHCRKLKGMVWDEARALIIDRLLWEAGASQEDFDRILAWYIDDMAARFSPRSYSWRQRIGMAFGGLVHWLFNPKGL